MKNRKTDRRTLMTNSMVKDAMLELLNGKPHETLTVTAICKEAEITRATFYLHYTNLDEVINELLDDALSGHILGKLYRSQKEKTIPVLMEEYGINEWEADKLFLFALHGNFAVNGSMGWEKDEKWYKIQCLIQKLLQK